MNRKAIPAHRKRLGDAVRNRRVSLKLSQEALAERIDCHYELKDGTEKSVTGEGVAILVPPILEHSVRLHGLTFVVQVCQSRASHELAQSCCRNFLTALPIWSRALLHTMHDAAAGIANDIDAMKALQRGFA